MSKFGTELCERSRQLAVKIIRLSSGMPRNPAGWEIAKQIVRSSNSVPANLEEAQGAISSPDFIHKVNLARKEARETLMWLRNIKDSGLLVGSQLDELMTEANEVVCLLVASVKTLQSKQKTASKEKSGSNSRFAIRDSRL